MNYLERRLLKRMLDEEQLEATNAANQRGRIRHLNRRDALKDFVWRAAKEAKNVSRKKPAKQPKAKTSRKGEPVTGHDLHGHD